MLPAQEANRTRVGATCSRAFKEKVTDYARRHGKDVATVVIEALADKLAFDDQERKQNEDHVEE